jgi:small subunit ribosomal protein S16
MSVKIRLRRTGANNDVSYRVVATDSRSPRDGKFIEVLGWYDPKKKGVNYLLKMDRIQHWTSMGAIVSDTVASLIKKVPAAPVAAPAEK